MKNSGEVQRAGSAADLCLLRSPFVSFAPVAQLPERRASNAEVAGGIPAGSANLFTILDFRFQTACGSPRTAEGPVSETVSLGGAIPLTPTILKFLLLVVLVLVLDFYF